MEQLETAGRIAGAVSAVLALLAAVLIKPMRAAHRARRQRAEDEAAFRARVLAALDGITSDVADLQYERLSQAHDFYTGRGWCPTSKKVQLCDMYRSYTSKGRNHLSKHYEKEILDLPEKPEEVVKT